MGEPSGGPDRADRIPVTTRTHYPFFYRDLKNLPVFQTLKFVNNDTKARDVPRFDEDTRKYLNTFLKDLNVEYEHQKAIIDEENKKRRKCVEKRIGKELTTLKSDYCILVSGAIVIGLISVIIGGAIHRLLKRKNKDLVFEHVDTKLTLQYLELALWTATVICVIILYIFASKIFDVGYLLENPLAFP